MLDRKKGKRIITILLVLSCIVSGIILAASPSYQNYSIQNTGQLDSLLNAQIQNSRINPSQVQVSNIRVDTIFTRKEFRIRVPSGFSKTLFHIDLHRSLSPYEIETPAKINFPSRDMDIYVYNEGTVLRTLRLTTDPEIDTLMTQPY